MKRKKALLKGPQEKQGRQSTTKGLQQRNKNPSGIITPLLIYGWTQVHYPELSAAKSLPYFRLLSRVLSSLYMLTNNATRL
jgi:hypothetical protein